MTVVLIGPAEDPQVRAVAGALDERGSETDVWDTSQWPGDAPLTVAQHGDVSERESDDDPGIVAGEPVDVESITGAYFRRMGFQPTAPENQDELAEDPYVYANQLKEYRGMVVSAVRYLESRGVDVVNPVQTLGMHGQKPYQLARFAEAGVPVPATCATNDPEAVRSFVARVDEAIYKPVSGGGHARAVGEADLTDDRLAKLSNSPVQFQERVDGENLRLFVVGGELAAAGRIETDALDYRTEEHDVTEVEPRDEIREAALEAATILDLPFAGVDVLDAGDRFVVLEANPSPMFAAFDRIAGTDVAGHLAGLLAEASENRAGGTTPT